MIAVAGKRLLVDLLTEVPECGDEGVFERGVVDADVVDREPNGGERFVCDSAGVVRLANEHVETIAEALDVDDLGVGTRERRQRAFGLREVRTMDFHAACTEAGAQFGGRAGLADFALVHEGDAVAALGFVEVWGGENNR